MKEENINTSTEEDKSQYRRLNNMLQRETRSEREVMEGEV